MNNSVRFAVGGAVCLHIGGGSVKITLSYQPLQKDCEMSKYIALRAKWYTLLKIAHCRLVLSSTIAGQEGEEREYYARLYKDMRTMYQDAFDKSTDPIRLSDRQLNKLMDDTKHELDQAAQTREPKHNITVRDQRGELCYMLHFYEEDTEEYCLDVMQETMVDYSLEKGKTVYCDIRSFKSYSCKPSEKSELWVFYDGDDECSTVRHVMQKVVGVDRDDIPF